MALYAFDLDGTLAPSKSPVSKEVKKLLRELLKKHDVAVISGGNFKQFEKQLLNGLKIPEGKKLYCLPCSGAYGYQIEKYSTRRLWAHELKESEREQIIRELRCVLQACRIKVPWKVYGDQFEDRVSQVTYSHFGQDAPLEIKEEWDPQGVKRKEVVDLFNKRFSWCEARIGGTTSIDVLQNGVNKAVGLQEVCRLVGQYDDVTYVGDALQEGGNDYVVAHELPWVKCIEVRGPDVTKKLIDQWCN